MKTLHLSLISVVITLVSIAMITQANGESSRHSGVLQQVYLEPDKNFYMPGDIVSVKGQVYFNETNVNMSLEKNHKLLVITKDFPISKNGTFDANFTIPTDTSAKSWTLVATVDGGTLWQDISFKSDFVPPLEQFWSGIPPNDIQCKSNFVLIFKTEDKTPSCVKPDTASILVERGWATSVSPSNHMTGAKTNDPFGITALIIYHPPDVCLNLVPPSSNMTVHSCPPNTFYLKINSVTTAYLMGYNICDADSCTKTNDMSALLPIKDILTPNFQMIGLPTDLKWKYGDTVKIQLYVSTTNNSKTTSLVDLENSTIVP